MAHFKPSLNSSFWNSLDTVDDPELNQRLGLYQLFLKLYTQNQGLLDEILNLENSGSGSLAGTRLPYMQGIVLEPQVYLITNLIKGKTQILSQPQHLWTIGRDPQKVGISIQDSRLSRCHAAIQYVQPQGFQLVDLNSSNGSFVNGELVKHTVLLKDGDRIRLGSLAFTFFVGSQPHSLNALSSESLPQLQGHLEQEGEGDRSILEPSDTDLLTPQNTTAATSIEDTLHFMRDQPY
ncbi:MAG TPA: FHA domain-containing protein [Crinalium sp.]|jgi:pSer/pThr/pTyr-binding forkhead associated (FHA) protein